MTTPTHGHAHRGKKTKTYTAWRNMVQRCSDPKLPQAKDYIGRGIIVHERWRSFANFLADMGEVPDGKMLDRINNDLGYFAENCRWTTRLEQNNNRRRLSHQKLSKQQHAAIAADNRTMRAIASDYGVCPQYVHRLKRAHLA